MGVPHVEGNTGLYGWISYWVPAAVGVAGCYLMCQLHWATELSSVGTFWGVSVKVFLEETSIYISRWSEADSLPSVGRHYPISRGPARGLDCRTISQVQATVFAACGLLVIEGTGIGF